LKKMFWEKENVKKTDSKWKKKLPWARGTWRHGSVDHITPEKLTEKKKQKTMGGGTTVGYLGGGPR